MGSLDRWANPETGPFSFGPMRPAALPVLIVCTHDGAGPVYVIVVNEGRHRFDTREAADVWLAQRGM